MKKLAESIHYEIYCEYEAVLLKIKSSNKVVCIGDFYGDVGKVIIAPTEQYCIMAGCGVIVYLLEEPYIPYEYEKNSGQWKEWYRDGNTWVDNIVLDKDILTIQIESGYEERICLKRIFEEGIRNSMSMEI